MPTHREQMLINKFLKLLIILVTLSITPTLTRAQTNLSASPQTGGDKAKVSIPQKAADASRRDALVRAPRLQATIEALRQPRRGADAKFIEQQKSLFDSYSIGPTTASTTRAAGTSTLTAIGFTGGGVTWASSNPAVATVSSAGLLTPLTLGTTTITGTGVANTGETATMSLSVGARFNPTTDLAVLIRLDHQSTFYSDAAGTIPATVGGPVLSIRDSTGQYLAVVSPQSRNQPILKTERSIKYIGVDSGNANTGFALNLGQPAALVNAINGALASQQTDSGGDYLTVLAGAGVWGDAWLLTKSVNSKILAVEKNDSLAAFGSVRAFAATPLDGTLHQYGITLGPPSNVGIRGTYARTYQDGAGLKSLYYSTGQDYSSDLLIGAFAAPGGPPLDFAQIQDKLAYFLILNRGLRPEEMADAEAFYRAVFAQPNPRARNTYNVVLLGNSFLEVTDLPEKLAAAVPIDQARLFNAGYGRQAIYQMLNTSYPNESKALIASVVAQGKPVVVLLQEGSNQINSNMVADYRSLWQQIRTDFPHVAVVVPTTLPRGGGSETNNPVRNAANAQLRDELVTSTVPGVFLADIASNTLNPNMAPDGSSNNTTYYGDTVHPTPAGTTIIADIEAPVFRAAAAWSARQLRLKPRLR